MKCRKQHDSKNTQANATRSWKETEILYFFWPPIQRHINV